MPERQINQVISEIIKMGDTPIHDVIISLIFTSGLKESIFREFKINDFIKACDDYFGADETHDIVTLVAKEPNQIFCCWDVKNGSNHQVTFSTPETTSYIFNYLKQTFDIENLDGEAFLFQIDNGYNTEKIRDSYVSDMIRHKRNAYNSRFDEDIRLTASGIIRNFKFICNKYLDVEEDKHELINLFFGDAAEDNEYYRLFKEDKDSIFQYYKQICPYLVINNVSGIGSSDESTTSLTVQQSSNQHTTPNTTEGVYQSKIKDYFDNTFMFNYMEGFSRQNNIKLLGYAFKIAKKDIEKDNYEESDDYYDNLLKKATFYVLYRKSIDNLSDNLDFDEVSPTEPQERLDMVCHFIKNMEIEDFNLSDDELEDIVGYQFAFYGNVMGEFNEEIFEKILLSSIFEIMKTNGMLQYIF